MAMTESERQAFEVMKRENTKLRKNQKPVEGKPVVALSFRQELNVGQKADFVKNMKADLLKLFTLNKPKNKLAKLEEFNTAHSLCVIKAESWLQKGTRQNWTVKSFTPVFSFDKENDYDMSYVDIEWVTMGLVKPDRTYKEAKESPTPVPEPIFVTLRVAVAEVL